MHILKTTILLLLSNAKKEGDVLSYLERVRDDCIDEIANNKWDTSNTDCEDPEFIKIAVDQAIKEYK